MSDHTRTLHPVGGDVADPAAPTPRTATTPARMHTPAAPTADPLGAVASAPGLPIPMLGDVAPTVGMRCVVTPIDRDGRLADRSTMRHLGWSPGQTIDLAIEAGPIVLVHAGGDHRVNPRGYLRIPLAVRQTCRVAAGDRVLAVTDARREELLLFSMATLYDMLAAYRRSRDGEAGP